MRRRDDDDDDDDDDGNRSHNNQSSTLYTSIILCYFTVYIYALHFVPQYIVSTNKYKRHLLILKPLPTVLNYSPLSYSLKMAL